MNAPFYLRILLLHLLLVLAPAGTAAAQEAKLLPSDGAPGDLFGGAVALSADGTYALVGAHGNRGRAYVFVRNGDTWAEQATLSASDGEDGDDFGFAVSISADGTSALIGAVGGDQFLIFARTGDTWEERTSVAAEPGEGLGIDVGIDVAFDESGESALAGARFGNGGAGSAILLSDGLVHVLAAGDGAVSDDFGWSVALNDNARYALIGAPLDADDVDDNKGRAYVFERSGGAWTEQAKLLASDGDGGDRLGYDVALSGDGTLAFIGAPSHTVDGVPSGTAYVFARTGETWVELGQFAASDGAANDLFGVSVALSGDGRYALVGAYLDDDNGNSSGSAYVYTFGAPGFDTGTDVGVDADGHAYFIGEFDGTFDFDYGAGETSLTSANRDVYVASYDRAGGFRFAFQIGNTFPVHEAAGGIAVSASGAFAVTGSQPFGTIDYDPDPNNLEERTGELFVAGYDADGSFRGALGFGGDGLNAGLGIALDAPRDVLLTGTFTGTTDFDPGPGIDERTGDGQTDVFMVKLRGVELPVELPVELASFEVVADGTDVLLRWTTASETDNVRFEVQQHTGGSGGAWQALAFVDGHGSTVEPQAYQHRVVDLAPGTHRFRLKQVDVGGTFAYSPEVEVAVGLPGAFALTSPYPTPFSAETQFTLAVQQAQHVQIAAYNVLGQRVALLHDGALTAGTTHRFTLDGATLSTGMFRVQGEQFQETFRVVLVR